MGVPSKAEIVAALKVPEVERVAPKSRGYIRGDVMTKAQRSQRDQWKSGLNLYVEKHINKKKMPRGGKWDV